MSINLSDSFAEKCLFSAARPVFIGRLERLQQRQLATPELQIAQSPRQSGERFWKSDFIEQIGDGTFRVPKLVGINRQRLRLSGCDRLFGRSLLSAAFAEYGREFHPIHPTQPENQKRIAVKRFPEQIVNRCNVLTGIGPVRARATGRDLVQRLRKQRKPGVAENAFDLRRHFSRQQLGGKDSLSRKLLGNPLPLRFLQWVHFDNYLIRRGARALDGGFDQAFLYLDRSDLPLARVRTPALQP